LLQFCHGAAIYFVIAEYLELLVLIDKIVRLSVTGLQREPTVGYGWLVRIQNVLHHKLGVVSWLVRIVLLLLSKKSG